jgi:hypothetical protein
VAVPIDWSKASLEVVRRKSSQNHSEFLSVCGHELEFSLLSVFSNLSIEDLSWTAGGPGPIHSFTNTRNFTSNHRKKQKPSEAVRVGSGISQWVFMASSATAQPTAGERRTVPILLTG